VGFAGAAETGQTSFTFPWMLMHYANFLTNASAAGFESAGGKLRHDLLYHGEIVCICLTGFTPRTVAMKC
jgi:hypothetical protein